MNTKFEVAECQLPFGSNRQLKGKGPPFIHVRFFCCLLAGIGYEPNSLTAAKADVAKPKKKKSDGSRTRSR